MAGLTSLPLLGSLAGCQQAPAATAAGRPAQRKVLPAKALPLGKVTDRISVITGAPGNVIVLDRRRRRAAGGQRRGWNWPPPCRRRWPARTCDTLFNTHYHADQTGGNALFGKAGAEIHAQTITRQWLAADYYVPAEDRWVKAPPKEAVPTVTFREQGRDEGRRRDASNSAICWKPTRAATPTCSSAIPTCWRPATWCRRCAIRSLDWYAGAWLGGRADAMDDLVELANEQTRDRARLRHR